MESVGSNKQIFVKIYSAATDDGNGTGGMGRFVEGEGNHSGAQISAASGLLEIKNGPSGLKRANGRGKQYYWIIIAQRVRAGKWHHWP